MAQLRKKLEPFNLHRPSLLGRALGVTTQRAHQLLRGDSYGLLVAKRISKVIGISWETIYRWQDDGH